MAKPRLTLVPGDPVPATALEFSEAVRSVVQLARRGGLLPPVFRSPPRHEGVDRTIRHRPDAPPVVAIRRLGRPLPAVQADVIEAVVVANQLSCERADRFRRAAWRLLEGNAAPGAGTGASGGSQAAPGGGAEHVA